MTEIKRAGKYMYGGGGWRQTPGHSRGGVQATALPTKPVGKVGEGLWWLGGGVGLGWGVGCGGGVRGVRVSVSLAELSLPLGVVAWGLCQHWHTDPAQGLH